MKKNIDTARRASVSGRAACRARLRARFGRLTRSLRPLLPALAWLGLAGVLASQSGCAASSQPTRPANLGAPVSLASALAEIATPGPIRFERVVAADWEVARSGLLNLDHPKARAAGLEDRSEPIEIFFYVLRHPSAGTFLVDSGVADGFRDEGGHPAVGALVESVMKTEALELHVSTAEWLAQASQPLAGVFVTHIHLDHVMGLPDVPDAVPVYVGPGETRLRGFLHLFTRGTIDRFVARTAALEEWAFEPPVTGESLAALDVFGDGSLFALHAPGHTPGSTAFLARTTAGPKLMVGDVSHTAWGWAHGVEPGSFTEDATQNAASLAALREIAAAHPAIEVHLGHQRVAE